MNTLKKTPNRWVPHDQSTHSSRAWHHASRRRARRVFTGLYALAVLCLLWCALPMPNVLSTASLLPAIVAAQIVGAVALLGWLLAQPQEQAAEHPAGHAGGEPGEETELPLQQWLMAVAQGAVIEATPSQG